jgi:putative phosphoesterase
MKLFVISDTHIPDRALSIPEKAESILRKRFDKIIHAGDLTDRSVLNYLEGFGEVIAVKGNMDFIKLPNHVVFDVENVKIGVVHGHGIYPRGDRVKLLSVAKKLGVDVLISGHTHSPDVYLKDDVLLLNPGSVTGAWGGGGGSGVPTFMVLDVSENRVVVDLYELRDRTITRRFEFDLSKK